MSKEPDTAPVSASMFKYEVQTAAGDLQTIADIMVSIGHAPDIQILHGWLQFFGRAIEAIADHLLEQAGRFE